jgi:uncharacterized repeat protein (TIGR04042 family)
MPEMHFRILWPDGQRETCYSPSLVIKDYLMPGERYALGDFLDRSRTALRIASDRVEAKFGHQCPLALRQLALIETTGEAFTTRADAQVDAYVTVEGFDEV